jgi:hypothetical protein
MAWLSFASLGTQYYFVGMALNNKSPEEEAAAALAAR